MNVSAVNPYLAAAVERAAPRAPVSGTQAAGAQGAQAYAAQATAVQAARPGAVEIPAEAPRGTDVKLWSVLTSEERAYFGRARAAAAPTYGPSGTASATVRGQLLNLRA